MIIRSLEPLKLIYWLAPKPWAWCFGGHIVILSVLFVSSHNDFLKLGEAVAFRI